jgi:hypothetical protein
MTMPYVPDPFLCAEDDALAEAIRNAQPAEHVSPWLTVSEAKAALEAVKLVHDPGLCDDHTCPLCWRPLPRDMSTETNGRS